MLLISRLAFTGERTLHFFLESCFAAFTAFTMFITNSKQMLKYCGVEVFVGNLGTPLSEAACQYLKMPSLNSIVKAGLIFLLYYAN